MNRFLPKSTEDCKFYNSAYVWINDKFTKDIQPGCLGIVHKDIYNYEFKLFYIQVINYLLSNNMPITDSIRLFFKNRTSLPLEIDSFSYTKGFYHTEGANVFHYFICQIFDEILYKYDDDIIYIDTDSIFSKREIKIDVDFDILFSKINYFLIFRKKKYILKNQSGYYSKGMGVRDNNLIESFKNIIKCDSRSDKIDSLLK